MIIVLLQKKNQKQPPYKNYQSYNKFTSKSDVRWIPKLPQHNIKKPIQPAKNRQIPEQIKTFKYKWSFY